jgi:hypothetical protein
MVWVDCLIYLVVVEVGSSNTFYHGFFLSWYKPASISEEIISDMMLQWDRSTDYFPEESFQS